MSSAIKSSGGPDLAQKRAMIAERLRKAAAGSRQSPLSFAQQRLWFLDQLEPDSALYNIGSVARVEGVIDTTLLEQSLDTVVKRHETLRTRFVCSEEGPVQIIDPHRKFRLTVVDLSDCAQPEREAQAHRLIRAEISRPFSLSTEHPVRASLIRLRPDEHRLVLILHHIVADEWSLKVLLKELTMLYSGHLSGSPVTLPEPQIQYADYARWQRQWLQGDVLGRQLDYWKAQLKDYPSATEFPVDHPRGSTPTFNGRTVTRQIGKGLTDSIRELANLHETTMFMALLAAFKTLVYRYTRQEDLIVCSPVAGRTRIETEGLIGFFVNTLTLRTSLAGDPTFAQLLARVREVTLGAMAHQDLPFDRLVEELQPERTLTHLPFTKLMFAYQSGVPEHLDLPGARLRFEEVETDLAKFEITLVLRETSEGLLARLEYNCDLFGAEMMERLLGHLETLLAGIVEDPGRPVSRLPLLTAVERNQVVVEWNQTSSDYPRDRCVHELFQSQAERTPGAIAVAWGNQRMSYGELNSRANQLARFLRRFEIKADVPVGLCVDRSLEMVVGMLGILKAGGAYVPLDASYPKERLGFMLEDTRAPVILTQQRLLGSLPRTSANVVCLDADWELIAREPRENMATLTHARHLAYVMYTSGSTGRPKGVAVPHRAVNRLVLNTDYISIDSSDRIAQVANISFDAATFELWGALLNGAQVIGITKDIALSAKEFGNELREKGITAMFLTAALFNQLASEAPGAFETLRTLIIGGEALDPKWVRAVLRNRPPQRLVNGYGPTENTTFTCCHLIRDLGNEIVNVPIGRPISNTTVYILDSHLNPVPIGIPGELYTGGDGLARGYCNRPELSSERFVVNPFDQTESNCLYRTGDLARYLPDGTVEFLGRIDDQVKIRGYRVELGEIETQLGRHPDIRACVVTVRGTSSVNKRLIAYVVPASERVPNASELRGFLVEKLPDYMIPSIFVSLSSLPLTPNGKLDRKGLPAPDQTRPSLDRQYVAPRDATERQLVAIWEAVLRVQPVGIQDKFFDLGGHSMLAVRVIAQIEKAFGRKLRLATLFQAPTIERLSAVLREEIKESSVTTGTSLVEIQGAGCRPPLFLVHGAGGGMFWGYVNLARCLGTDQPVYGFKSRGLDGHEEFGRLEEMAAQYISDLRSVQPRGPYFLGGYCFGGNVAYEMACQLTEQGEQVDLLALINCAPPNSRYTRIPWTPRWCLKLSRNLIYWANYFGHWSANQRREFFRWKWHLLKKRLTRACGSGEFSRVEPGDLVDLSSYTDEQKVIWETHIRGLMNFRPRQYDGKVHLFRSPGHPLWCSFDEDYGWGDLARRGVKLITVSAAHEKILEEPWVKTLGQQLSAVLCQAQESHDVGSQKGANALAEAGAASTNPVSATASQPSSPDVSSKATYPELFASRTGAYASKVSIRSENHELSYSELDKLSNRLAHYLQEQGVGPESLVAVCLERSIDLGVALLAVMKAGGAYLPLDPDYPAERLNFMVQDARPTVLLTHSQLLTNLPGERVRIIELDNPEQQAAIRRCSDGPPTPQASADNLAYVIYTSGSSGVPKGVQITHRALANHSLAVLEAYGLQTTDRILQFTPLSFDISVEEIFPTWLVGGTLVFRTEGAISSVEHFVEYICAEGITVLNLPTAYWHELTEFLHASGAHLPECLRMVIIGGEKPADEAFRRWKESAPEKITLINAYGITEATITTTVYHACREEGSLAIGRPIANTQAIVLDECLGPVPRGMPGELYIGGDGLARGYLNRPELTARAFITNPVPSLISSERLYRTGDMVRERDDGNLEFIGRLDDQVKVRGFRIELGEIEAALREHPGVKEAAVIVREGASATKRVIAYYVPRTSPGPGVSALLSQLRRKLPSYMIPSVLVSLPQLPLTPAGKVDRGALPVPGSARPDLDQQFMPASSPLEDQLAKIWSEVLELARVGVDDNFIELGGQSLLATKAVSRIRETFQVELSLTDFFANPTISLLASHLNGVMGSAQGGPDKAVIEGAKRVQLSPSQERIWFLDQLEPSRTAYNRAVGVHISGGLDVEALKSSLLELSHRQDALRAVFPAEHGEPNQLLVELTEFRLPTYDLSGLAEAEREQQAMRLVAQEASRPHILSQPVFRALLLRLGDAENWLALILNEIAADENSLRLILQDLQSLYAAAVLKQPAQLAPLSADYCDQLASVADLSAETEKGQLDYWKNRLGGAPELLDLPCDRPRPARGDYAGARCPLNLDDEIGRGVEKLALELDCNDYAIFLAVLATLLHRYTGNQDIVVGSVTSLRTKVTQHLVGPFENRVALRCDVSGDPTFRDLIGRCGATLQQAHEHRAVPFRKVVEMLHPQVSASYTPIFQVFLSVEQDPLPESAAAGLRFAPFEIDTQTSRFDLSLKLVRNQGGFSGRLTYSTALFDSARISRMAQHFEVLLRSAMAEPDRALSKLDLLPEHEAKRLLVEWTATGRDYPKDKTLIDLFREQTLGAPSAEALVCGDVRLTYAQLLHCATQVASHLRNAGVGTESLVGICFERSPEMIAAMLGTLLAGGAYVPLDPKYPKDRLSFTLQDAKVKVLLTQSKLVASLALNDAPVLCLDSLEDLLAGTEEQPEAPLAESDNLAYVIYTSGSTGKPKGVALEHRNAVALVSWAKETFSTEELSGVLASTSICFDLSVFEIFVPLCCGGKIILTENALELKTLGAASEVRLINTVPSAMRELLRVRAVPAGVHVVNLAGEPLSTELVDQIYKETSVGKVFDLYGPTETTTYSTGALRKPGQPATIGRPLANEQVYLLDSKLHPVPMGIPGELFIGGDGLARGYLNRPELTAEKFIPHPFKCGARLYRTGDLARWRADGNLEYLGRLDHQVKIRGFRIELGEIEAVLKNHPGVGATLVVAREDYSGDKRLVAYVVPRTGASVTAEELKKSIREELPEFMVPSVFLFLQSMPMTPNGKIDRKALPAPETPIERKDLVAPRTATEAQLADIWCEVLRLKQVSVNDNFFDLGGHSLLAVRVIAAIRDIFKVELPLTTLFSAPTIAALSEVLSASQSHNGHAPVEAITPTPRTGQLPVSYVQERLWFLDQLNPGSAAYNVPTALRLKGPLEVGALRQAVNTLISRHEALRAHFNYGDNGLTQQISGSLHLEIPCVDIQGESAQDRERVLQDLINRDARQAFDLATGPLIRASLFRIDETDHVLLTVMHHTISDGWSLAVFFQELGTVYDSLAAGRSPAQLTSLPIQYPDFADWQRQRISGPILEDELGYWKKALDGVPPELQLPLDHSRPAHPSGRADCRTVTFGTASVRTMSEFGRREGCTPFMVFLTALMITLQKWTGQQDLVIGTVVAGRTRRELENVLGCFMNFLPLRARLEDSNTGREVLDRVRTTVLDGQTHQDCPFEKIVEAVNPQRRQNQNPLYNVALLLQNFPANLFPSETLQAKSMPVSLEAALLDLRFEIESMPEGLSLSCEYRTDLFEPATVEALLSSWRKVMEALLSDPESHLPEFEIDSALKPDRQPGAPAPATSVIAIASTFTAEPVAESLQFWLGRLNMAAVVEFAAYNQVFQQLLDADSLMARNRHGVNIVLARLEDWLGNESASESPRATLVQNLEQSAGEFVRGIRAVAASNSVPFLICFCPSSTGSLAEPSLAAALGRVERQLEQELAEMPGVYLLTARELAKWYPVQNYYDSASEELGHVPYTPLFFTALGTALARKFHALNRPPYKVIALDCDNTLWSGVCGEDGPNGIQLDAARRELQEFMRAQRDSGMLLCLCSKNNEEDVHAVFDKRSDPLPLQMKDFAACRLNWRAKSENLQSLSKELGLGLDSFIFLDDNPVECAEVQAQCPEVLALQLPGEPSQIQSFLQHCWAFDHLKLTSEDRKRAELYEQNRMREQLRAEAPTLDQFLAGLDLKITIEPISPSDWTRVAQLTQRTNQFNFTTRRLTERELGLWLNSAEGLTVRVSDRFGDYGLVGTILYRVKVEAIEIDTLLLSCRVLGRGVEHRMLAKLGEIARDRDAKWVDAHFVPSAKNKPALDFLEQLGGSFKQPLNGGSVFRIPVDFAVQIAFHPASERERKQKGNPVELMGSRSRAIPDPGARFSSCLAIALEANDAQRIHHEMRKGAELHNRGRSNYVPPSSDLERQLCALWQDLLHVQPIGVQDDFFELGGHSLLAVRLFSEIHKSLGRKFPLVTLFQAPTIAQLARVLAQTEGASSLLVPIQPQGNQPPLFLVHGAGGDVLWGYANLATHLSPNQPVYGIKSHGQEGGEERQELEEMARAYLDVVKTRQPEGPYFLGGYCFGGNVAYEMARQLQMSGQEVALVVLIDTAPANVGYERVTWWRPAFAWRFVRNLRFWLEDFIALEGKERRKFFVRKLRCIGRKLQRCLSLGAGPARFDLEEVIDPGLFPEHELKLWQAHLEALVAHVERPYAGPVALLRTRGQPLFCCLEEDFCWGKLVRGGVSVRCVPGSHENIFMEPNVQVLASELTGLLKQAQSSSLSKSSSALSATRGEPASHL